EEHCEFVGRENLEHIKTLAIRGFDCIGGQILIGNEKKHGNPVSALCAFLPFLEPSVTGEYNSLPGYNAAYKRRALESVKKDLPLLFGYEALLLNEILKKKFKIYIEPSVKIKHYFENRNINTLKLSFFYNINFSHARKTYYHWSGFQVVMRTLMAVLIPFTRTIKFLIEIYRSKPGYLSGVLKNIHLVFLIHLSAGLGTLCGYYFWSNRHNVRFTQLEYNIER
ncbi:MAG TPA: hypothetical protein VI583_07260, partial [Cyclobacteriaceae bacterium]|nr:hypothetical protein [Cyclobacteriaceae bacterium]